MQSRRSRHRAIQPFPFASGSQDAGMKRRILAVLCLLLLLVAGTLLYVRGRRYEIVITQQQIDSVLQAKFPVSKSHLFIFRLTYSNPRVTLLPDADRIQVALDAELNLRIRDEPKTLAGSAVVTAVVAKRAGSSAL